MTDTPTEPGLRMTIWVIYGPNNLEHPGFFLVRAQDIITGLINPVPRAKCTLHATLDEARKGLPEFETYPRDGVNWASYLTRLERSPGDDPSIVETWL